MRNASTLLIALIWGLLVSPRPAGATIDLQLQRPAEVPEHVTFTLSSPALAEPVRIVGDIRGAIYFETDGGRTYLLGTPSESTAGPDRFHGVWTQPDGRRVIVAVSQDGNRFDLAFEAVPDGDIRRWGFALPAAPQEYFTGLFERTVDGNQRESWRPGITEAMNLRGQKVEMSIKPTLSLYCPFFISSRGYSVFTRGTWPGGYDFCVADPDLVQIQFDGPSLALVINTADHPAELVKAHSLMVGPTIVPPRWAFRPWRWRDDHNHRASYFDGTAVTAPYNSEVVEDVLMMEALDIPCGVYWVDRPWAVGRYGYDDFVWDEQRLPNPREMIGWINDKGMEFVLWIAPWVNGQMADFVNENGYRVPGQTNHVEDRPLIDFTNPAARRWWQQQALRKVLEDGVAGFKLDRSEEITPNQRDTFVHDGRSSREYRNDYPVDYVKATYEITREIRGDDFVLLPRAAYTHSSRYGVFWGGDIGSPPEGLRCAIIAQLRSAIIGYPIWGSDTGGYWAGDLDREVCARWLAFSCFCGIMEVGPTENVGLWDMKRPPHYDTELIAIWRLYAQLRERLLDYTCALADEARATGMPMARPLFLHWPEQSPAWQEWQTYMYGPDILVSALWEKGQKEHRLYLPAGVTWVNAWNPDQRHQGGRYITVPTPLHQVPVFVRQDSEIDLGDLEALYRESIELAERRPSMATLQAEEFE